MVSSYATTSRRDETGASAVEYALVMVLIALVIIVAVTFFGSRTTGLFRDSCDTLSNHTFGSAC